MTDFNRIDEEAAQWVARQDRSLNFRERISFEHWLKSSTANRVAYLRLKAGWDAANKLSDTRSGAYRAGPWSRSSTKARLAIFTGLAASAVMLWFVPIQIHAGHKAPAGDQAARAPASEHQSLALADGTRVYLGSGASVRTAVSGATRSVTLEQGNAYFEVKHDDKHPFVVFAGNRKITDLGTKFSVALDHGDIQVKVKEGSVQIQLVHASNGVPVVAEAGDVVVTKADETMLDMGSSGAPHLLSFDNASLEDVALELNKYNQKKIYVADNAANIRIGGSFQPDNMEGFESLLKRGFEVKVREAPDGIHISR
jgi:transmembrane sensor